MPTRQECPPRTPQRARNTPHDVKQLKKWGHLLYCSSVHPNTTMQPRRVKIRPVCERAAKVLDKTFSFLTTLFLQPTCPQASTCQTGEITRSVWGTSKKYKFLGSTPRDAKSVTLEQSPEVYKSFEFLRKCALSQATGDYEHCDFFEKVSWHIHLNFKCVSINFQESTPEIKALGRMICAQKDVDWSTV